MKDRFMLICGSCCQALGARTARILECARGRCLITRFPDGEVHVELMEPVRGRDVYILQSTSPPVDENWFELLGLVDACRRACAARIVVVLPYFGYARSDQRGARRGPVLGRLVAEFLESAGADHVLTIDLHAPQIEGFFKIPVDSITAVPALCYAMKPHLPNGIVVVSPDEGRVRMAADYARRLGGSVAVLHKNRRKSHDSHSGEAEAVGDVRGRPCLIVDDLIATGKTLEAAVRALLQAGAAPRFWVAVTHAVLVSTVREALQDPAIQRVVVTDSVPHEPGEWPGVTFVSLAPLLAAVIHRLNADESLADVYEHVVHGGFEEALSADETPSVAGAAARKLPAMPDSQEAE